MMRYKQSVLWKKAYPVRKRLYPLKQGLSKTSRKLYHALRAKFELISLKRAFRRRYGGAVGTASNRRSSISWPHRTHTPYEPSFIRISALSMSATIFDS